MNNMVLNRGDLVVYEGYYAIVLSPVSLALSNGCTAVLDSEAMLKNCTRLGLYNGSSIEQVGSPANFNEWLKNVQE
jgi:hypothetical protein